MTAGELYVRLFTCVEHCGDALQEGRDAIALQDAGKIEHLARDLQAAIVREHKLRLAEAARAVLERDVENFAERLHESCNRELGRPEDEGEDELMHAHGDVVEVPATHPLGPGSYTFDPRRGRFCTRAAQA